MHRYYFEHGHNNILRFLPDQIRIENYWVAPLKFVLGKTVYRRNPVMADLFSRIRYGEKMGTGFERIKEMCDKENAPHPAIDYEQNFFHVTFKQSNEYLKATENTWKIPGKYLETREKTREKSSDKIVELIR
jgi:ATP-dependent DNA helicase RecG